MAKGETTAVAVKNEAALAVVGLFEQEAGGGFDHMGQEDFALPFLRLLTSTSPMVAENDNARPGMVANTVTGELYDGKAGLQVIPCAYVRQYIEWAPRGKGPGAPIAIYPSTSDILTKTHREPGDSKDWLDNGNYVEATASHFVLLINDSVGEPALISMKSTQLKKSRRWNSMMQAVKMMGSNGTFTPPMYSQVYRLTTVAESNEKGKWHGWEIERVGPVTDMALYQQARTSAQQVKKCDVKVKHDFDEAPTDEGTTDVF